MIHRIIKKLRKSEKKHVDPYVPDDQRIYCIGDIHGCADLLEKLHQKIRADAEHYCGKKTVVYLGDYIDRGADSRQVIEMLVSEPLVGFDPIYLKGNHEQAMLDFIENPEAAAAWLSFGGREALNSYGNALTHLPTMKEIPGLSEQLDQSLPDTHRAFITNNLDCWQCGSYYFVHAGIRPGVALQKQTLEDKLWIRDDFLRSTKNHAVIVVHGHSVTPEPTILPNRIGIDTGAFNTGVLTCLVLEGNQQRLLQT